MRSPPNPQNIMFIYYSIIEKKRSKCMSSFWLILQCYSWSRTCPQEIFLLLLLVWRIGKIRALGTVVVKPALDSVEVGPAGILLVLEFYHGLVFDLEEWNLKNDDKRISKKVLSNFCDCWGRSCSFRQGGFLVSEGPEWRLVTEGGSGLLWEVILSAPFITCLLHPT